MLRRFFPCLFGLFFIAGGILFSVMDGSSAKTCTEPVLATFVGYEESTDEDSTSSFPVFEYRVDGKNIRSKSHIGSSARPYTEGETYNLRYNPDDPYDFYVEGDKTAATATKICVIVGIVCIIIGILSGLGIGANFGGGHAVYTSKNGTQASGLFVDLFALISWAVKNHKDKKAESAGAESTISGNTVNTVIPEPEESCNDNL